MHGVCRPFNLEGGDLQTSISGMFRVAPLPPLILRFRVATACNQIHKFTILGSDQKLPKLTIIGYLLPSAPNARHTAFTWRRQPSSLRFASPTGVRAGACECVPTAPLRGMQRFAACARNRREVAWATALVEISSVARSESRCGAPCFVHCAHACASVCLLLGDLAQTYAFLWLRCGAPRLRNPGSRPQAALCSGRASAQRIGDASEGAGGHGPLGGRRRDSAHLHGDGAGRARPFSRNGTGMGPPTSHWIDTVGRMLGRSLRNGAQTFTG